MPRRIIFAVAAALSLLLFFVLAWRVSGTDTPLPAEESVASSLAGMSLVGVSLIDISGFLVDLGSPMLVVLAAFFTTVVAVRYRVFLLAALAGTCLLSVFLVQIVLKPTVARSMGGVLAFPSGHTSGALVSGVLFTACLLTVPFLPVWLKRVLVIPAAFIFLSAALTPVILGFHYPTDSLGSLLWVSSLLFVVLAISPPSWFSSPVWTSCPSRQ